jgi:putative endopeptidase
MSKYLNQDFVQTRFQLYDRVLFGRLIDKPRWMTIVEDINQYIGELLGELYVYEYFPYQAKQRMLNLTNHLIEVYHQRILRNEWMSKETKEKALIKLAKINNKIGYPSQWKSYSNVHINRWSYFDSMLSALEYGYRKKIQDLNQPPDRNQWFSPPQTVNAFYVNYILT